MTTETNQSLWRLVVPPAIWAAHFTASYATAAIWCVKVGSQGAFWQVRAAIAVYSILALAGIAITGWMGYGECRSGEGALSSDTPESRYRFLGFATLLLSALSAVAIAFNALVLFFFRSCA
jgi:hypothetical protein